MKRPNLLREENGGENSVIGKGKGEIYVQSVSRQGMSKSERDITLYVYI